MFTQCFKIFSDDNMKRMNFIDVSMSFSFDYHSIDVDNF